MIEEYKANLDYRMVFISCPFNVVSSKFKISPDTFVQIAIQLAYYRLYGKLVPTYETGHTRQFRHGRTETVRSATEEALQFCQSQPLSKDLFEKAAKHHKDLMMKALQGMGCDRSILIFFLFFIRHQFLSFPDIFLA